MHKKKLILGLSLLTLISGSNSSLVSNHDNGLSVLKANQSKAAEGSVRNRVEISRAKSIFMTDKLASNGNALTQSSLSTWKSGKWKPEGTTTSAQDVVYSTGSTTDSGSIYTNYITHKFAKHNSTSSYWMSGSTVYSMFLFSVSYKLEYGQSINQDVGVKASIDMDTANGPGTTFPKKYELIRFNDNLSLEDIAANTTGINTQANANPSKPNNGVSLRQYYGTSGASLNSTIRVQDINNNADKSTKVVHMNFGILEGIITSDYADLRNEFRLNTNINDGSFKVADAIIATIQENGSSEIKTYQEFQYSELKARLQNLELKKDATVTLFTDMQFSNSANDNFVINNNYNVNIKINLASGTKIKGQQLTFAGLANYTVGGTSSAAQNPQLLFNQINYNTNVTLVDSISFAAYNATPGTSAIFNGKTDKTLTFNNANLDHSIDTKFVGGKVVLNSSTLKSNKFALSGVDFTVNNSSITTTNKEQYGVDIYSNSTLNLNSGSLNTSSKTAVINDTNSTINYNGASISATEQTFENRGTLVVNNGDEYTTLTAPTFVKIHSQDPSKLTLKKFADSLGNFVFDFNSNINVPTDGTQVSFLKLTDSSLLSKLQYAKASEDETKNFLITADKSTGVTETNPATVSIKLHTHAFTKLVTDDSKVRKDYQEGEVFEIKGFTAQVQCELDGAYTEVYNFDFNKEPLKVGTKEVVIKVTTPDNKVHEVAVPVTVTAKDEVAKPNEGSTTFGISYSFKRKSGKEFPAGEFKVYERSVDEIQNDSYKNFLADNQSVVKAINFEKAGEKVDDGEYTFTVSNSVLSTNTKFSKVYQLVDGQYQEITFNELARANDITFTTENLGTILVIDENTATQVDPGRQNANAINNTVMVSTIAVIGSLLVIGLVTFLLIMLFKSRKTKGSV